MTEETRRLHPEDGVYACGTWYPNEYFFRDKHLSGHLFSNEDK